MADPQGDRLAKLEAELAKLHGDNTRLRRLLTERDAPRELRHRQRNSLAMLRMLVRSSAETRVDLEDYVAHLEDRLDAIGRVQAAIDMSGQPDLATIIAGELLAYTIVEGDQARLTGPTIRLEPRAAQAVGLAIHELAVNAVEHGVVVQPGSALDVSWNVADRPDDAEMTLVWKETGFAGLAQPTHHGFGTEVLTETLGYELKATTALVYEPDGLRCTIRFPLPGWIGHVQDDAEIE